MNTYDKKVNILVVEDEVVVGMEIRQRLKSLGYNVVDVVSSEEDAIKKAEETHPHLVLMDIKLGGKMDGINAAAQIKNQHDIPVIYITAYSDDETLRRAKITEPYGYILKPFEERELHSNIEIALYKHEIEKKVKDNEEKYRDLFENANDIIQAVKPDGRFLYVNNKWKETLGYDDTEISKLNLFDIIHPDSKNNCKDIFNKILSGEKIRGLQASFITKNGKAIIIEGNINCRFKDGKPVSTRGIFRDITKQKKAQDDLKRLNEELEKKVNERTLEVQKLLKQKDEFINQLGHDLKNPLTPILGFLPIIEEKETDPEKKELIKITIKNAKYIKELVEKTLKLARLDSPETKLEINNLNLYKELCEVIINNKPNFEKNNVKIENLIDKNFIVKADKIRLKELFDNLISNAIKYTPKKGKIVFDAERKEDWIEISITDTGNGLTNDQIEHIFDEFYKVDESRHDFESSGLGLPICKKIVEKHGGKIWVNSPGFDKGSTFYFTLKSSGKNKEFKNGGET